MSSVAICHLIKNNLVYTISKQNSRFFSSLTHYHNLPKVRKERKTQSIQWESKLTSKLTNDQLVYRSIHLSAYRKNSNSEENQQPKDVRSMRLPQLMDFPQVIWPSFIKSTKNWILITFIVRPYFDQEFNIQDFAVGSQQALQVVSQSVCSGEFQDLNGLVSEDAKNELQKSVSQMSIAQRSEVSVIKDDIYFTFPYQVGIMFDETNQEIQKRWVEITMVFHVLRGLKEMRERGETIPLNIGMMPEYRDKISICNYRFIKEFTQGIESDWTINMVNHFKPADILDED